MEFAQQYSGITCGSRLIGKKQDYTAVGSSADEKIHYLWTFDGHGKDDCINVIRSMNLSEIAELENPIQTIAEKLSETKKGFWNSGSTCNFIKINDTSIQCSYAGDSQVAVFINDSLTYFSEKHCAKNETELLRIKPLIFRVSEEKCPALISPTKLSSLRSDRIHFKNGTTITPSQVLGHNNVTGLAPTTILIPYNKQDSVRVISASDGFWDMIFMDDPKEQEDLKNMSLEELLDKAENRWKQPSWEYAADPEKPDEFIITNFGGNYDDICIGMWSKQSNITQNII